MKTVKSYIPVQIGSMLGVINIFAGNSIVLIFVYFIPFHGTGPSIEIKPWTKHWLAKRQVS